MTTDGEFGFELGQGVAISAIIALVLVMAIASFVGYQKQLTQRACISARGNWSADAAECKFSPAASGTPQRPRQ